MGNGGEGRRVGREREEQGGGRAGEGRGNGGGRGWNIKQGFQAVLLAPR